MKNILQIIVFSCFFLFISAAQASSYERFITAVQRDDLRTVQALAARGLDMNSITPDLQPPLVLALTRDSLRVAEFLVQHPTTDLNATNTAGEDALMVAALRGHLSIVQQLLTRNAQVNRSGWAPLHYGASHAGGVALPIVRLLLEHHAYIDAASPNASTPLMMAARYGQSSVVELLLEEGADPSLRNQQGLDAVDFALQAGRDALANHIAKAIRSRQPSGRW
jgi:ankyrin repeat protein